MAMFITELNHKTCGAEAKNQNKNGTSGKREEKYNHGTTNVSAA